MRRYYRDWIAWSVVAAIAVAAGTEYYVQRTTGQSTPEYVYKLIVTAPRQAQ